MAYGQHQTAVDGNVLRIYARLYGITMDILSTAGKKAITAIVEDTLPYDRPGDFNQALMDFGSAVCIPKRPRCQDCPLKSNCLAYGEGQTDSLPVRIVKTKVKTIPVTVAILSLGPYYLLHKRPNQGLLQSMWEFPSLEGAKTIGEGLHTIKGQVEALLGPDAQVSIEPKKIHDLTHVFSHRKWLMKVYQGTIKGLDGAVIKGGLPADWMLVPRQSFTDYAWAGPHGKLTEFCK